MRTFEEWAAKNDLWPGNEPFAYLMAKRAWTAAQRPLYASINKPGDPWPGEWCKRCERRNNIGFTLPDGVWDAVVRGRWGVLCPTCFDIEAEAAGIEYAFDRVWPLSWSDWKQKVGA